MQRARSNALTGASDPRFRSPAEIQLFNELQKPADMAPELEEFVRKVFADPGLMAGGNNLADKIYNLYSSTGQGSAPNPSSSYAKNYFDSIFRLALKYPFGKSGFLQYADVQLSDVLSAGKLDPDWLSDFIYFLVGKGGAVCRLYLNVKPSSIGNVFDAIGTYIVKNPAHGVGSFKVVGPADAGQRADTFVIYCSSKDTAEKMGAHMLAIHGAYNNTSPALTTQLKPGVGVSIGAEPERQATGLGSRSADLVNQFEEQYKKAKYSPADAKAKAHKAAYEAQSFGSIRSELIAAAILNFNTNKKVIGSDFNAFKRFVCVAFRSNGLNPMQPGS